MTPSRRHVLQGVLAAPVAVSAPAVSGATAPGTVQGIDPDATVHAVRRITEAYLRARNEQPYRISPDLSDLTLHAVARAHADLAGKAPPTGGKSVRPDLSGVHDVMDLDLLIEIERTGALSGVPVEPGTHRAVCTLLSVTPGYVAGQTPGIVTRDFFGGTTCHFRVALYDAGYMGYR